MKIKIIVFTILLTLFTWVSANLSVKYSKYNNDWTLKEQYFEFWNSGDTSTGYDARVFQVSTWTLAIDWCTPTSWWEAESFAEYWTNLNWLGRIEIINNLWRFKPWLAFKSLPVNWEVVFCYNDWNINTNTVTKIKIIKTQASLVIKSIWTSNDKRVFLSKQIWPYWSDLEIFFRCEEESLFSDYDTWEMEEKIYLKQ